MELRPSARAIVRLAIALVIAAAAAAVWEILARQAPSSGWHMGVLPGPVAELRDTSVTLALLFLAVAWLLPAIAPAREPWVLVGALHAGAIITVAALTYGATTGMYGIQIDDPRADSVWLFKIRTFGQLLLVASLLDVARRFFFRPRAAQPPPPSEGAPPATGSGE